MARLILLLVLGMITYFTVKSVFKRPRMPKAKNHNSMPPDPGHEDGSDMKQDPVCGTYVEPESSVFLIRQDQKLYFCSETCRKKFLENN